MKGKKTDKRKPSRSTAVRPPFWMPANAFYASIVLVALVAVLAATGLVAEGGEGDALTAPLLAGLAVLAVGVFFREVILRRRRSSWLSTKRRLDENITAVRGRTQREPGARKLSAAENAELVRKIVKKSEAAREFMNLSEGHFEVTEACAEYLELNRFQIENANLGSPRLAELKNGRGTVRTLHRFHLLAWAEIESRELTDSLAGCGSISDRLTGAQKALRVLDTALSHYPEVPELQESKTVVQDMVFSLEVSAMVEAAGGAAKRGETREALGILDDVLHVIADSGRQGKETEAMVARIKTEISRLAENPVGGDRS